MYIKVSKLAYGNLRIEKSKCSIAVVYVTLNKTSYILFEGHLPMNYRYTFSSKTFKNNVNVLFADNVEPINHDHTVSESLLLNEFGEDWFQPKGLIVRPDFIVDQYSTSLTIQKDLEVKLKSEFFNEIHKVLEYGNIFSSLSGYLMFDIDLKDLVSEDDMQLHASLFSNQVFRIIKFVDDEASIKKAEKQLARAIRILNMHIHDKVLVEGVIAFPCKVRSPASIANSNNSVLYKNELARLFAGFSQASGDCNEITADNKVALRRMLQICFFEQYHPRTKQEATCFAAQKLFLQRPNEKIKLFSQIDFNLIKLTDLRAVLKMIYYLVILLFGEDMGLERA